MGSLWEEAGWSEATAREQLDCVREQIAELNRRLVAEEEALSRLVITWEAVVEILGDAPPSGARDRWPDGSGIEKRRSPSRN